MSTVKTIEVLIKWKVWYLVIHYHDGSSTDFDTYPRQRDGHHAARALSRWIADEQNRPVELLIKDRKGRIRLKDTFGHDPEKSRG